MSAFETITTVSAFWFVLSIPFALFVGAFVAVGTAFWELEHGR